MLLDKNVWLYVFLHCMCSTWQTLDVHFLTLIAML